MTTPATTAQSHVIHQDRLVQTMLDLIRIDSPTGQEQAIADELTRRLVQLGGTVSRDGTGNLIARFPGTGTPMLLSCHMDTVVPGTGIKPVIRDGVVYSDGTTVLGADDKSGIAIVLETLQQLHDHPDWARPPLEFVLTVSEEQGLVGSRNLDMSQFRAHYGFVLDTWGPIGSITTAAPSTTYLDITITGKRAHGGVEPEKGISAIRVASEAIASMPLGRIDPVTTSNVGTIHGGDARNVVPERVVVQAMARSTEEPKLQKQVEAMQSALRTAADRHHADLKADVTRVYSAYTAGPGHAAYDAAARAYSDLGIAVNNRPSTGGTDANNFNAAGLPAVALSTGMRAEHSLDEHIAIQDLYDAARAVMRMVSNAAEHTG